MLKHAHANMLNQTFKTNTNTYNQNMSYQNIQCQNKHNQNIHSQNMRYKLICTIKHALVRNFNVIGQFIATSYIVK